MALTFAERLATHLEAVLGAPAEPLDHDPEWKAEHAPGLTCLAVPPAGEYGYCTFVSSGLSRLAAGNVEYVISSPFATLEHAALFNMIAAAIQARGTSYALGDVIPIGRPWIEGATAAYLQVSLPYPYGPELEKADAVEPGLRLLWLVPIHASEAEFLQQNDVEALEQRFEDASIDFVDPARPPVV